jgi:hypothetical protein
MHRDLGRYVLQVGTIRYMAPELCKIVDAQRTSLFGSKKTYNQKVFNLVSF